MSVNVNAQLQYHYCTQQAFANYLAYKCDNNELLLFILRQLASDHLTFNRNRYGGDFELVEVPEEEFIEKVYFVVNIISQSKVQNTLVGFQ